MPKGVYPRTSKSIYIRTEETKRKTSDSLKGHKHTKERRRKQSIAAKKRFENPEEREKISRTLMGEKSPNWKGGVSFERYPREFNDRLKETIRERDNHTCQLCGKTKEPNGNKLSVHHIDYNK